MAQFSDDFRNTRTDWASLSWKDAQTQLISLLSKHQFMRFEEVRLESSKRADLIVIRNSESEIIFGVIEVKSYRRISPSIKNKAITQVCGYLNSLYNQTIDNARYGKKNKRYFACVVFTHDYPSITETIVTEKHTEVLEKDLITLKPEIFLCTPENLVSLLFNKNLGGLSQQSLDKYYEP